jgi:methylglyoxal synthase
LLPPAFAVFAEPRREKDLLSLLRCHRQVIAGWRFLAPVPVSVLIRERLGLVVEDLGEDGTLEMAARVSERSVDFVIFLGDTLSPGSYDPAFDALIRACDVYDAPLATSLVTASLLIDFQADHDARVAATRAGPHEDARSGDETSDPGPSLPPMLTRPLELVADPGSQ